MTFEDPTWVQGTAGAPSYSAREDRLLLDSMWDEGVLGQASFKVTQRAAGATMSVDLGVGRGVVKGDDQTSQGSYIVRCTVSENLTVAAAPGANSRYDLVVVEVNDPNATNVRTPANVAEFKVITGTVAASPVVPALPATAIPIAVIGPIVPATGSITNAMIYDITNWAAAPAAAQAQAIVSRQMAGDKAVTGEIRSIAGFAPNGWLLAYGQSLATATYPDLFAAIAYSFGGSGPNFNVPDLRGRTMFGLDNMGGTDAGRLAAANTLGLTGGEEYHTNLVGEMPAHTHPIDPPNVAVSLSDPTHYHSVDPPNTTVSVTDPAHFHTIQRDAGVALQGGGAGVAYNPSANSGAGWGNTQSAYTGITAAVDIAAFNSAGANTGMTATVDINPFSSASAGSGTAANNMPPYMLMNYIIRT